MTVEVKKIPPLTCPQCNSTRVDQSFTNKVKTAFLSDGRIWCRDCKQITDTNTGKVEKIKSNRTYEERYKPKLAAEPEIRGRGEERQKRRSR